MSPLWISLKTALTATALAFLLGVAAARWMMGYRGPAWGLIDGLLILPLVLPPTVVGFLLLLLVGRNGPIGQLLQLWDLSLVFTWGATVLAATVVAFPLMYKIVLSAFEQVEPDLLNCARTLGASEWQIFWQILLPLSSPGVAAGIILAFARALGEFGATLMVAGSIPGVTQTIPIVIFFAAEAGRMGEALNWVLLIIAVSLGAIAAIHTGSNRHSRRSANALIQQLFNLVLFGQLRPQFNDWPALSRPAPEQPSPAELQVKLQKSLPGFQLTVDFRATNQPLGILGASGAGKSMMLRCIAGLETPDQGRIVLNRRVLFDAQRGINVPGRDRNIGFLFQNYALFPHFTAAQNVAFGLQHLSLPERRARVAQYLALVQLTDRADHYPHQLSGGQQQRVALARALAVEPAALLLDEPLSALDTYLRSQIERLMSQVLSTYPGVTLFVTHKLEEAYRVCNELLILSQGEMIAAGPKANIFERPATFAVAQVTECKNFSRVQIISPDRIQALDWNCSLKLSNPVGESLTYVGIRAHHLTFPAQPNGANTYRCWLAMTSETQHRMTLYLKLEGEARFFVGKASPTRVDYHLQAEVYKEKWLILKQRPFPWYVRLAPERLILMED